MLRSGERLERRTSGEGTGINMTKLRLNLMLVTKTCRNVVGNNAASLQRLSDPLDQSYKRTLLEYIHSQENP